MNNSITLPKKSFEENFESLLNTICEFNRDDILDFSKIKTYMPSSIVAILAKLTDLKISPNGIKINNESDIYRYLQRINFFNILFPNNEQFKEDFSRHHSNNFVPIQEINNLSKEKNISEAITSSIWGNLSIKEEEKYNINLVIQYAIGEIVRNVIQHSEALGYINSQYYPTTDYIRIGIADAGIGILESFKKNGSPFYQNGDTDLSMLKKALTKKVSSKTHFVLPPYSTGHENKGVGLTMIKALCRITYGHFIIASGNAYIYINGNTPPIEKEFNGYYKGTICSIAMQRKMLDNYNYSEIREEISKEALGTNLTEQTNDSLFI